jgi:hypothetical protein
VGVCKELNSSVGELSCLSVVEVGCPLMYGVG